MRIRKALALTITLAVLLVLTPGMTACGEVSVIGPINDSASIALLRYEVMDDGFDGVVYRQVNRFSALMAQSDTPLLVVFYSPLAEINIQVIPRLEQMAYDYQEQLQIVWVDAGAEKAMAETFDVSVLPQFTVVVDSSIQRSLVGYGEEGAVMLAELLEPYLPEP